MSELAVLQALQAILQTEFDRVYVYPDDFDTMPDVPDLPFHIIQQNPTAINITRMEAIGFYPAAWEIDILSYLSAGLLAPPSTDDAAYKALARATMETIRDLLRDNQHLSGTIYQMGDGDNNMWNDYLATEIPWNKSNKSDVAPYDGCIFEIPVMSG